jgi:hypothetical protein
LIDATSTDVCIGFGRQHTRRTVHTRRLLTHLFARVRRRVASLSLRAWHACTRQLPPGSPSATAVPPPLPPAPAPPPPPPPMPHTPRADWRYADDGGSLGDAESPPGDPKSSLGGGDLPPAAAAAAASPYAEAMKREVQQVARRLVEWMDGLSTSKREVRRLRMHHASCKPRGCSCRASRTISFAGRRRLAAPPPEERRRCGVGLSASPTWPNESIDPNSDRSPHA